MLTSLAGLALLLPLSALAQFVTPPSGLQEALGAAGVPVRYKVVPSGICESRPNVTSYAVYSDIADDKHMYMLFYESREADPATAPLTVFFNGGPGSSSMRAAYEEIGPCGISPDGEPYDNPYAWNRNSNLLFMDQPLTAGNSYTRAVPGYLNDDADGVIRLPSNECPDYAADFETCGTYSADDYKLIPRTSDEAAPDVYLALQGFLGVFPQYGNGGLAIAGQSYGGRYAPAFADYILKQAALKQPGHLALDVKTVLIGNAWIDPLAHYESYFKYLTGGNGYGIKYPNSTVEAEVKNNLYGEGNCLDQIKACQASTSAEESDLLCQTADDFCATLVEGRFGHYLDRPEYDVRYLLPYPFPYSYYEDYLQQPVVQDALAHFSNYSGFSQAVFSAFDSTGDISRTGDAVPQLQRLLAAGVNVALYSGSADYNVNWIGTLAIAEGMGVAGFDKAGFQAFESGTGSNTTAVVKQAGSFSFTRVFDAGHEVPFYQPITALELFERSLARKDLATGRLDAHASYLSSGPLESTQKEDVSTVQYEVTPDTATYNTTTHKPDVDGAGGGGSFTTQPFTEPGRLLRRRDRIELARRNKAASSQRPQRPQRPQRLQRPFRTP